MNEQKRQASPSSHQLQAGSGFTMVELLVVMLVITVLLVIGVPAIMTFRTNAKINACQVTVNAIDTAIGGYYSQHKQYPEATKLVVKLVGLEANDYHPGPGYRLQERGQVYPPWNGVDKLNRGVENFIDVFGNTIWYCPFKNGSYSDSTFTRNNTEDNVTLTSIADYATDANGKYYRRDYILMSPSADGKWGKIRNDGSTTTTPLTDDVTNFFR
jgi:competence protein ComGC